jgi:aspartate racemase
MAPGVSQHIGIVACSAPGAALCYRTICAADPHPEVSLHGAPLADYVACLERDDWDGVAALVLASAEKLAAVGADFLIVPDNTIHAALPRVIPRSPRPWLHIAEVVADEARARGFRRVGVTGTRWLVDGDVYPAALAARGIEAVRPAASDRDQIDRLIMEELVHDVVPPHALATMQGAVARLAEFGCDAVVLGCTELPLVLDEARSPLPTLDSTRLLARAALARATLC